MKVTKEVTFDSAHMLSNYRGKCRNLHGHTYKLQVTLEGDISSEGNSKGMVMDFNELKQYIDSITNTYDHAIIFSDVDNRGEAEDALYHWAEKYNMNFIVVPGKCTSESIAKYIAQSMFELVDTQGLKVSVKLWETPTSFVEV